MTTVAERVARGAELLDEKEPGWPGMISLATLDMRCNCVIHQVGNGSFVTVGGGSFLTAIAELGLSEDDAVDLGFWWDCSEEHSDADIYAEIDALDAAWRELILARRSRVTGQRGRPRLTPKPPAHQQIPQVPCPLFGADAGQQCRTVYGANPIRVPHFPRREAAIRAGKHVPR